VIDDVVIDIVGAAAVIGFAEELVALFLGFVVEADPGAVAFAVLVKCDGVVGAGVGDGAIVDATAGAPAGRFSFLKWERFPKELTRTAFSPMRKAMASMSWQLLARSMKAERDSLPSFRERRSGTGVGIDAFELIDADEAAQDAGGDDFLDPGVEDVVAHGMADGDDAVVFLAGVVDGDAVFELVPWVFRGACGSPDRGLDGGAMWSRSMRVRMTTSAMRGFARSSCQVWKRLSRDVAEVADFGAAVFEGSAMATMRPRSDGGG